MTATRANRVLKTCQGYGLADRKAETLLPARALRHLAGVIAPVLCWAWLGSTGGQSPRPSARPAIGGRWPALFPDLPICGAPSRAGGGNGGRVSFSRPH